MRNAPSLTKSLVILVGAVILSAGCAVILPAGFAEILPAGFALATAR